TTVAPHTARKLRRTENLRLSRETWRIEVFISYLSFKVQSWSGFKCDGAWLISVDTLRERVVKSKNGLHDNSKSNYREQEISQRDHKNTTPTKRQQSILAVIAPTDMWIVG